MTSRATSWREISTQCKGLPAVRWCSQSAKRSRLGASPKTDRAKANVSLAAKFDKRKI